MTQVETIKETATYTLQGLAADWDTRASKTRVSMQIETTAVWPTWSQDPEFDEAKYDAEVKVANRLYVKEMKAAILEANKELDFLPKDGWKLTFSRTAGCGCGCSPAFILNTSTGSRLAREGSILGFANVWITTKK